MAQLVVAAAGAAIGGALFPGVIGLGITGAGLGWAVGSVVGSQFGPSQEFFGPRLQDLRAPKLQYGARIPRFYGRVRTAGIPWFRAPMREVAITTESDGKGGSTSASSTTYTYYTDVWFVLSCAFPDGISPIAVTRIWRNGDLIWSALADSSADTIEASGDTAAFSDHQFFTGDPDQMPWAPYEEEVGTENAIGLRHRASIGLQDIYCGTTDQIPLFEFEIITAGAQGSLDATTRLQTYFTDDDSTDISVYANGPGTLSGEAASLAAGRFSLAATPLSDGGTLIWEDADIAGAGEPVTIECIAVWDATDNAHYFPFLHYEPNTDEPSRLYKFGWTGDDGIAVYDDSGFGTEAQFGPVSPMERVHFALVLGDTSLRVYFRGQLVYSVPGDFRPPTASTGRITLGNVVSGFGQAFHVDEFAIRFEEQYTSNFTPPEHIKPPDGSAELWTPEAEDLADVVSQECAWNGLDSSKINVEQLGGYEVIGEAFGGPARESIEIQRTIHHFDAVCTDVLTFVMLGGDTEASIPFADSGVGVDAANDAPFTGPGRDNEVEVSRKVHFSYAHLEADYDTGTEQADRLSGNSDRIQTVTLPSVMTGARAKGVAETLALRGRIETMGGRLQLGHAYAALQPTSVFSPIDDEGTTYRARITSTRYADGVYDHEYVLDDPSAIIREGVTANNYQPVIEVLPPGEAETILIDGPLLGDAYEGPHLMVAIMGSGDYRGAVLYKSLDGVSYSAQAEFAEQAIVGAISSAPGAAPAVLGWDYANYIDVSVGDAVLSSSTRAALQDGTTNAALIGSHGRWEAIQFINCEQLSSSPNVYRLTGLLRGLRGSEQETAAHEDGDTFVMLRTAGLRRVALSVTEISVARFWKGVPFGRSLSSADVQELEYTGVALEPFAPTRLRGVRDPATGDIALSWSPRTRLAVRHGGSGGTYAPNSWTIEEYTVRIYDDDTYTTVVRTVEDIASPSLTYTAAQQTADFGSTQAVVYFEVMQVSDAGVGTGYPLREAA